MGAMAVRAARVVLAIFSYWAFVVCRSVSAVVAPWGPGAFCWVAEPLASCAMPLGSRVLLNLFGALAYVEELEGSHRLEEGYDPCGDAVLVCSVS